MQSTAERAVMELREVAVREPGPQQLLVRMRAASLNRGEFIVVHDMLFAQGRLGSGE